MFIFVLWSVLGCLERRYKNTSYYYYCFYLLLFFSSMSPRGLRKKDNKEDKKDNKDSEGKKRSPLQWCIQGTKHNRTISHSQDFLHFHTSGRPEYLCFSIDSTGSAPTSSALCWPRPFLSHAKTLFRWLNRLTC